MIVAILGMVSKVDEYEAKESKELIRTVFVAAGENMLSVRMTDDQDFAEMDLVMVCGELKVYERRFYVNGGSVRAASVDDRAFFKAGQTTTLRATSPPTEVVAPVAAGAKVK